MQVASLPSVSIADWIAVAIRSAKSQSRELSDFFGKDFKFSEWQTEIPIRFGFGPPLSRIVSVIHCSQPAHLNHDHVTYPSPSCSSHPYTSKDVVLPVVFSNPTDHVSTIDQHLSLLVDEHFHDFPSFSSRFKILHSVYKLYFHYMQTHQDLAYLLRQALKLLVLVSCSDVTISTEDKNVGEILNRFVPGYTPGKTVTPCILRAELGAVIPQLARILLQDVLRNLLRICLMRRCEQHPIVIATFSVLMMTIESIMWRSARIGYHAQTQLPGPTSVTSILPKQGNALRDPFASTAHPIQSFRILQQIDDAATTLQTIYRNCFENDHTVLLRAMEQRSFTALQKTCGEHPARFIASLNQAVRDAGGYIETRGAEKIDKLTDISDLFDRLLSRLFLLQTNPW